MKKKLLSIVLILGIVHANAQNNIIIDGASKPAVHFELKANDKDVKNAMEDYFKKAGGNLRGKRGFYSSKEMVIPQLGPTKMDVYFSFSSRGRRNSEVTTVLMAAKPSSDVFVGDSIPKDMFVKMDDFVKTIPTIVAEYLKAIEIEKLTKAANKDEKQQRSADKKAAKRTRDAEGSKKKLEDAKSGS